MALLAGEMLELELPRTDQRLLVVAETDSCTVEGHHCCKNSHFFKKGHIVDFLQFLR